MKEEIKILAEADGYTDLSEGWQDCGPSGYNILEGKRNGHIQAIPNYLGDLGVLRDLRERIFGTDDIAYDYYFDLLSDETGAGYQNDWGKHYTNYRLIFQATAEQHAKVLAKMISESKETPEETGEIGAIIVDGM